MLVRVPVIGTIGRAVRLNPNATVGGQIGVNITLPDGSTPTFEELAIALDEQLPPESTGNALGGGGGVASLPGLFRGSTNVNITTLDATMDLTSEILDPDANYSLSADVITVGTAGYYSINFNLRLSVDSGSGATNGSLEARVTKNGTSSEIIGSQAQTYMEENNNRDTGVSNTFIVLLAANDTIRLRARFTTTTNVSQVGIETYLSLHKIRDA